MAARRMGLRHTGLGGAAESNFFLAAVQLTNYSPAVGRELARSFLLCDLPPLAAHSVALNFACSPVTWPCRAQAGSILLKPGKQGEGGRMDFPSVGTTFL